MKFFVSPLEGTASITDTELTSPLNLAGLSALSLPLPTSGARPAGLQLVVAPCFRRGPAAGRGRAPSSRRSLRPVTTAVADVGPVDVARHSLPS